MCRLTSPHYRTLILEDSIRVLAVSSVYIYLYTEHDIHSQFGRGDTAIRDVMQLDINRITCAEGRVAMADCPE